MPLPGGPADKLGNRYETYWTVLQMLEVLEGTALSIRIEDPNAEKVEFVLQRAGGGREFHQCKRSHTTGKWTLSAQEDILTKLPSQLAAPATSFVFVSGSDSPDLRELTERSHDAESYAEFENKFLAAQSVSGSWNSLRQLWPRLSEEHSWALLKKVTVRVQDEQAIMSELRSHLRYLYGGAAPGAQDHLLRTALYSVHRTLDSHQLRREMESAGFKMRTVAAPADAASAIEKITASYLRERHRNLIRDELTPRRISTKVVEELQEESGKDVVLLGPAGVGKSTVLMEIVDALRGSSAAVLYLRLDKIETLRGPYALGKELGLDESPVHVLAAAGEHAGKQSVIIIDQLDAVSTTSARSVDRLDLVEELLEEAAIARRGTRLQVMVACRKYDWENDHRLQRLIPKDARVVREVEPFSEEEIKVLLASAGFAPSAFTKKQLDLLRLPQNLFIFLRGRRATTGQPSFVSRKELFDDYWNFQRPSREEGGTEWVRILELMAKEMSEKQQLYLEEAYLDEFDSQLIERMVSDGVLSRSRTRLSFQHESFFDYCFARSFLKARSSLVKHLKEGEQHLFRRSQVRQILEYLRDAEPGRYVAELRALIGDNGIRLHVKDAAISFLMSIAEVSDQEWELFEPFLQSHLDSIRERKDELTPVDSLIWRYLRGSPAWFQRLHEEGELARWLASDSELLLNFAVNYLRAHTDEAPDIVAELLEPYVDAEGDAWKLRFQNIISWTRTFGSRRLMDLVLRLIETGKLDEARGPVAVNSTFWNIFWGLSETRPDWTAEVIGTWFRRQIHLREADVSENRSVGTYWLGYDQFADTVFHRTASGAPEEFLRRLLPDVLQLAESAIDDKQERLPYRDRIWSFMMPGRRYSLTGELLDCLLVAMEKAAEKGADFLQNEVLPQLVDGETWVSNYLLLNLYRVHPHVFADQCAEKLSAEPWRFDCSYANGGRCWIARETLAAVAPSCSPESYEKLEMTILEYVDWYEKTEMGYKHHGEASFSLLTAINDQLLSDRARRRLKELKRKFGDSPSSPSPIEVTCVGSPIPQDRTEHMSDEQWMRALRKYNTAERERAVDWLKGGGQELAGALRERAKQDPERFARLALQFDSHTYEGYFSAVLDGIKESSIGNEMKLQVCEVAFAHAQLEAASAVSDVIVGLASPIPERAIEMLEWYATHHPEPEQDSWNTTTSSGQPSWGGCVFTNGLNVARGRMAQAVAKLIWENRDLMGRLEPTVRLLCQDPRMAVRSMAAECVLAIGSHDFDRALDLLPVLLQGSHDRLLPTPHVERLLYHAVNRGDVRVHPVLSRMIHSEVAGVQTAGARLSALAAFTDEGAAAMVDECLRLSPAHRKGIAEVAVANFKQDRFHEWCERTLLQLADDEDASVAAEVGDVFGELKDEAPERYQDFIGQFIRTKAFCTNGFPLLHLLEETRHRLPGIVYEVCRVFLLECGDEASDIRTPRATEGHMVAKLVFRTYTQHQEDEWARPCLDLIDLLIGKGSSNAKGLLDEYER